MRRRGLRPQDFPEARVVRLPRGAWVCEEGRPADGTVWFVVAGEVHVLTELPDGGQAIPYALGPGDLFGDLATLLPRRRRTASVRTAQASILLQISPQAWQRAAERPGFAARHEATLFARFLLLDEALRRMAMKSARDRLLMLLAERIARFGAEAPLPTHAALAMMIGCTRERATRLLGAFVREGLLRREGRGRYAVEAEAIRAAYSRLWRA